MYCPKCGSENPESVNFCQNCGASLRRETNGPQISDSMKSGGQAVINEIRALGSSSTFLTGAIAYSVYLLFALLSAVFAKTSFLSAVSSYLGSDVRYAIARLSGVSVVLSLIGLIPAILIAVGIWMTFYSLRSQNRAVSTAGLSIVKVVLIINLIGVCIMAALLEIGLLMGMVGVNGAINYYSYSRTSFSATPIFIGIMIGAAGLLALAIVYYVKLIQSITTIKTAMAVGVPSVKISGYVIVMCYILGAIKVIGGLFSFMTPLSMLATLAQAVAYIAFGMLLSAFRLKMYGHTGQVQERQGYSGQGSVPRGYGQPVQGQGSVPRGYRQPVQGQGSVPQGYGQPVQGRETTPQGYQQQARTQEKGAPGETSVLNAPPDTDMGTTVLKHALYASAKLIRKKDGAAVYINTPNFRIGKGPDNVDYAIPDNAAISRYHAYIFQQNGAYYIVDNDSTNHVYVNRQMIQANAAIEIRNGYDICLADEEFQFVVE